MTTDSVNTRELILEILLEVTERGQYSHLVIRSVLEKYQYLDKRERAFLTRVAEGTIQRQIELDYILDQFSKVKVRKMKPVIRGILADFPGCILSVSHDRKFMEEVCGKVLRLTPAGLTNGFTP